jgi:hypothetical protein
VTEKKKVRPAGLIAAAGASVAAMMAGSVLGTKGTIIGAALGAVISGTVIVWIENAALKAHDKVRQVFTPSDADSTRLIPAIKIRRARRPLILAAIGLGVMLASASASAGVLFAVKGASGTTLGNYAPPAAPSVSPSPSYSTPSPAPSPSPSPSYSPSQSPSPSESTVPATPEET